MAKLDVLERVRCIKKAKRIRRLVKRINSGNFTMTHVLQYNILMGLVP